MRAPCLYLFPSLSLPTRGAWIEIHACDQLPVNTPVSLPTRGAWIEMQEVMRE